MVVDFTITTSSPDWVVDDVVPLLFDGFLLFFLDDVDDEDVLRCVTLLAFCDCTGAAVFNTCKVLDGLTLFFLFLWDRDVDLVDVTMLVAVFFSGVITTGVLEFLLFGFKFITRNDSSIYCGGCLDSKSYSGSCMSFSTGNDVLTISDDLSTIWETGVLTVANFFSLFFEFSWVFDFVVVVLSFVGFIASSDVSIIETFSGFVFITGVRMSSFITVQMYTLNVYLR